MNAKSIAQVMRSIIDEEIFWVLHKMAISSRQKQRLPEVTLIVAKYENSNVPGWHVYRFNNRRLQHFIKKFLLFSIATRASL